VTGRAACCSRTASGHAAALARSVMNVRRLMTTPHRGARHLYHILTGEDSYHGDLAKDRRSPQPWPQGRGQGINPIGEVRPRAPGGTCGMHGSCSSAVRPWTGHATSGGTSSPHARRALSRPKRTGTSLTSTACWVRTRSSSHCRSDSGELSRVRDQPILQSRCLITDVATSADPAASASAVPYPSTGPASGHRGAS
jgi:hypothetical protein